MIGQVNSEMILYIYMIVSVLMIGFNVIYMGARKSRDKMIANEATRIGESIGQTVGDLKNGRLRLVRPHIEYLQKYLSTTMHLIAFNAAMEKIPNGPDRDAYLREINGAFIALNGTYRKKNPIIQAYFAYTLTLYRVEASGTALSQKILDDVTAPSMYLRENSLNALCRMDDARLLADAIARMSRLAVLHTHKLITDALLEFTGDHEALCKMLFDRYPELRAEYKLAVLNYIGYKSPDYATRFLPLLHDEGKEIRIAVLRYLRKHPLPEAEADLLAILNDADPAVWECAAVAASALSAYGTDKSRTALRAALTRSNWYIRQNAADSLLQMKLSDKDIEEILQSGDRYALEMFQYRLNEKTRPQKALPKETKENTNAETQERRSDGSILLPTFEKTEHSL